MKATLYLPQRPPQSVSTEGLGLPNPDTGFASVSNQVPLLLGCDPKLVDVLACAPNYVAYSVFDYEGGQPNNEAMLALAALTGYSFNTDDEDTILLGPILVVVA